MRVDPTLTQAPGWTRRSLPGLLGWAGGKLLAPVTAAVAALRHARMFHPEGAVYRARVEPLVESGAVGQLAQRLSGEALVRLSSAWWRGGRELPDVLGVAVRFRVPGTVDGAATPEPTDQDLLFATIRLPLTTLLAPLSTHQHDFLMNDYYAVSPFQVKGLGRAKFRVVTPRYRAEGPSRGARFAQAVREGHALFELQLRGTRLGAPWRPVAALRVLEEAQVDQEALRFSPFRSGRGVEPRGLVHALRFGAYAGSQAHRPESEQEQEHLQGHLGRALQEKRERPSSRPGSHLI